MKLGKNQKVFLSYAWTGEDAEIVKARMEKLAEFFRKKRISYYCNLEDTMIAEFQTPGQFIKQAIKQLKECDEVLAIVSSERRSQGQLMEIGAAISLQKPVVTALHSSAIGAGYLDDLSLVDATFVWADESQLLQELDELL